MPHCISPFFTKEGKFCRCSKCPACKKSRASEWSFRLMQEYKYSHNAHFITLTYEPKTVPYTTGGLKTLRKRDVQLFCKKLRNKNSADIRYYAVGEYGTRTQRPHYHIILYNAEIQTIQPSWPYGHVHYGFLSEASVGYTLKYISKPCKIGKHEKDHRNPQFAIMSKGIGLRYLTKAIKTWHLSDVVNRMYCNLTDGKKISMPRYYKLKLYDAVQRDLIGKSFEDKLSLIRYHNDLTPNYRRNKKQAVKAAFNNMKRNASLNEKL